MEGLLYQQHEKTPVALLINGGSGVQTGNQLISHFSGYNGCYVFNLADLWDAASGKCQSDEYNRFCETMKLDNIRIVAGGGDGTVSFVCGLLDYFFQQTDQNPQNTPHKTQVFSKSIPPIGILPIGVGNELSRCLGWSKSFTPSLPPLLGALCCSFQDQERSFIRNVRRGPVVDLDTWNINFESNSIGVKNGKIGNHTLLCFFFSGI